MTRDGLNTWSTSLYIWIGLNTWSTSVYIWMIGLNTWSMSYTYGLSVAGNYLSKIRQFQHTLNNSFQCSLVLMHILPKSIEE